MPKPKKKKQPKPLLPVDIRYSENAPISSDVIFAVLPTLDELDQFWKTHRTRFPYAACDGGLIEGEVYLRQYEWVFASTIPALIKAVTRWEQLGIKATWYDWANEDPRGFQAYFRDIESYRKEAKEHGNWEKEEESDYQARRQNYRGWWELVNLPQGQKTGAWLGEWQEEIADPSLTSAQAEELFQVQAFENWKESDCGDVSCYDLITLDEFIAYWQQERQDGQDYYGSENELACSGS